MKVLIMFLNILILLKLSVSIIFSKEEEEFFHKNNEELIKKNPVYIKILEENGLHNQRGVDKILLKNPFFQFVTYGLDLSEEELKLYRLAIDIMFIEMPTYIEREDFEIYFNEIKFSYILDHLNTDYDFIYNKYVDYQNFMNKDGL